MWRQTFAEISAGEDQGDLLFRRVAANDAAFAECPRLAGEIAGKGGRWHGKTSITEDERRTRRQGRARPRGALRDSCSAYWGDGGGGMGIAEFAGEGLGAGVVDTVAGPVGAGAGDSGVGAGWAGAGT